MSKFNFFLLGLAVVQLISVKWLPARFDFDYPRETIIQRDTAVDEELLSSVADKRPDIYLLGNSMVAEGIDEELFNSLVPGETYKLGIHGSASAVWYLVLKNVICTAEHHPRTVVFFFRDIFLTYPNYRVDGKYRSKVDRYAGSGEELLDRLAYLEGMGYVEYYSELFLPLFSERTKLKDEIIGTAKYGVPFRLAGYDSSAVDRAIDEIFADDNMNQKLLTIAQLAAEDVSKKVNRFDFNSIVESSFLPAMLEMLEKQNIELVMARIKRRRDLEPGGRSEILRIYAKDLDAYLASRGVTIWDYTDEEVLVPEYYGEGDHLNEKGREVFTRLVAKDLLDLESYSGGIH